MPDPILNFEEHRRRRDENPSVVPCARCGKSIVATATRCPECGVHFRGEAQFFSRPNEQTGSAAGIPWKTLIVTTLVLIGLLFAAVYFG